MKELLTHVMECAKPAASVRYEIKLPTRGILLKTVGGSLVPLGCVKEPRGVHERNACIHRSGLTASSTINDIRSHLFNSPGSSGVVSVKPSLE